MTKSEHREVMKARAMVDVAPRYAAVTLCTLFRSARTTSSKQYMQEEILNTPAVRQLVSTVNGCFVVAEAS